MTESQKTPERFEEWMGILLGPYDQDYDHPIGSGQQTAEWWRALAFQLEHALMEITACGNEECNADLIAAAALGRFERAVAGGDTDPR